MKAVVAAFNQEKALVGAFSVITNLRMDFFEALVSVGQVLHTVQAVAPEQCWGRLHAATGDGGHGRGQPPAQH